MPVVWMPVRKGRSLAGSTCGSPTRGCPLRKGPPASTATRRSRVGYDPAELDPEQPFVQIKSEPIDLSAVQEKPPVPQPPLYEHAI